jgi:hypothetical protein
MTDTTLVKQKQIAELLGVGEQAVKKWRGFTLAALRKAGQFDSPAPTCPLPTNALPIPANQRAHVLTGDPPRWDRDVIIRWAELTQRRDERTGAPMRPVRGGKPPDPDRQARVRRAPMAAAAA